jgi:hypothetical protein
MPKNIGGGNRFKKQKFKGTEGPGAIEYPDEEQEYGVVVQKLGNGLLNLMISKGPKDEPKKALGKVRGALKYKSRRAKFEDGSILIVSRREFEHSDRVVGGDEGRAMVDILHCYHPEHKRVLINDKLVHSTFKNYSTKGGEGEDMGDDEEEEGFVFDSRTEEEYTANRKTEKEERDNLKVMIDDL